MEISDGACYLFRLMTAAIQIGLKIPRVRGDVFNKWASLSGDDMDKLFFFLVGASLKF